MGDGRFVACCVVKIQNKLKYNYSGRVSLLQVATVAGISTNWFENFQRFELFMEGVTLQNVIIAAKFNNIDAKCNNCSTKNVITFLTQN